MSMKADYNHAIETAQKVIKENFITAPPVVAESLARNYGLDVLFFKFKPEHHDVSGFIDKMKRIIVNADDSAGRQNFTIAHELGHYLMGHLNSPDYDVLYRRPIGEQPKKTIEQEANCFAANLLVPENILRRYISTYPFADNHQLGRVFGVSSDVIAFRRQILGV